MFSQTCLLNILQTLKLILLCMVGFLPPDNVLLSCSSTLIQRIQRMLTWLMFGISVTCYMCANMTWLMAIKLKHLVYFLLLYKAENMQDYYVPYLSTSFICISREVWLNCRALTSQWWCMNEKQANRPSPNIFKASVTLIQWTELLSTQNIKKTFLPSIVLVIPTTLK